MRKKLYLFILLGLIAGASWLGYGVYQDSIPLADSSLQPESPKLTIDHVTLERSVSQQPWTFRVDRAEQSGQSQQIKGIQGQSSQGMNQTFSAGQGVLTNHKLHVTDPEGNVTYQSGTLDWKAPVGSWDLNQNLWDLADGVSLTFNGNNNFAISAKNGLYDPQRQQMTLTSIQGSMYHARGEWVKFQAKTAQWNVTDGQWKFNSGLRLSDGTKSLTGKKATMTNKKKIRLEKGELTWQNPN